MGGSTAHTVAQASKNRLTRCTDAIDVSKTHTDPFKPGMKVEFPDPACWPGVFPAVVREAATTVLDTAVAIHATQSQTKDHPAPASAGTTTVLTDDELMELPDGPRPVDVSARS